VYAHQKIDELRRRYVGHSRVGRGGRRGLAEGNIIRVVAEDGEVHCQSNLVAPVTGSVAIG